MELVERPVQYILEVCYDYVLGNISIVCDFILFIYLSIF